VHRVIEQLLPYLPNIRLPFADASVSQIAEPETRSCPWTAKGDSALCFLSSPALSPYIDQEGFLTPCCRTDDISKFGHANIAERPFAEIWQSDAVRRYVHDFIEKGDAICAICDNRRRGLFSTPTGPADVEEAIEKVLIPAVNFALALDDEEQAAEFREQFARSANARALAVSVEACHELAE
jgi:hypothetical protein